MGLTSALSVGRAALATYQAALQVVGNNMANSATPGYTRTSADLSAIPGVRTGAGQVGGGVYLAGVRRNMSDSIQMRLRSAISDQQSATAEQLGINRLESIMNPLGDDNLATLLSEFFGAIGDLQNNPENQATRGIVLNSGDALTQRIRDIRQDFVEARDDLNTDIDSATARADEVASQIAVLNTEITIAESGTNSPASALRDQRDQLINELSQYFEIVAREQPTGAVNIYVGNDSLVQFGQSFGMKTVQELNADGLMTSVVRFKHNNGPVTARSGEIEGLINARDGSIGTQMSRLDTFTAALIQEVNMLHAGGKGLEGFTSLTSLSSVNDPTLALSSTSNGLAFQPQTGSFYIDVKDASGSVVRTQIHVDLDGIGVDSTLNSVAADITANTANVTATVLADGRLELTADSGYSFTFGEDSSGFLGVMGVNAFFSGEEGIDIAINPLISSTPSLLAAAQSDFSGDGSNATALARLQDQAVASLGGMSLNDYYNASVSTLAVDSSSANSSVAASTTILDSLSAQRESISGVSLDEEAVAMMSYQRAFQGAARFINVVDEMMQTLLSLVR